MSEFVEVWRRETDKWVVVEFEKRPNALCCNVMEKASESFFAFGSLGVNSEKLEEVEDEILNVLLAYLGQGALDEGWNVSTTSLWKHLLAYTPSLEEYIEGEDSTPEGGELLGKIWVFLSSK
jgi:hypothetical protein